MSRYAERAEVLKALTALDGGGVKEGDLLYEVGYTAFDGIYTDSTSRPVVTKLNKIVAGFAVAFDSYSPATDASAGKPYLVFVAPDISEDTNSHLKTFSIFRSSAAAISGLKVAYQVWGKIYHTD